MNSNMNCPCCPAVPPPADYPMEPTAGLSQEEVIWSDDKHLSLGHPSVIKYLDKDLNTDTSFTDKLATNYGCCSAFRLLSDEGIRCMDLAVSSIEKYAKSTPRIPKALRGGTFRSEYLNGMGHSAAVLRKVSELAGCEMIYHPMRIQQLHINFKPDDQESNKKNVDKWHCDGTPFVLIVFGTDPDVYTGGNLQYFNGTKEEGTQILSSGQKLPSERVLSVGRQEKGFGVFMQGWRVFHQVTPVLTGNARTTLVYSFHPRNVLALEACSSLSRMYNTVDPLHMIMSDWARYRAWKTLRRMEICLEHWGSIVASIEPGLNAAIVECRDKMGAVVHSLPYTSDRELMRLTLDEAILPLRAYIHMREESDANPLNGTDFCESQTGWPNIVGAVSDITNCVDDILTLKDSKMVFF